MKAMGLFVELTRMPVSTTCSCGPCKVLVEPFCHLCHLNIKVCWLLPLIPVTRCWLALEFSFVNDVSGSACVEGGNNF